MNKLIQAFCVLGLLFAVNASAADPTVWGLLTGTKLRYTSEQPESKEVYSCPIGILRIEKILENGEWKGLRIREFLTRCDREDRYLPLTSYFFNTREYQMVDGTLVRDGQVEGSYSEKGFEFSYTRDVWKTTFSVMRVSSLGTPIVTEEHDVVYTFSKNDGSIKSVTKGLMQRFRSAGK